MDSRATDEGLDGKLLSSAKLAHARQRIWEGLAMVVGIRGRSLFICNPRSTFTLQILGLAAILAIVLVDSGAGAAQLSNDAVACFGIFLFMLMLFVPRTIIATNQGSQLRFGLLMNTLATATVADGSLTLKEGHATIVGSDGTLIWQAPVVWLPSEGQRETTRALLRFAQSLTAGKD